MSKKLIKKLTAVDIVMRCEGMGRPAATKVMQNATESQATALVAAYEAKKGVRALIAAIASMKAIPQSPPEQKSEVGPGDAKPPTKRKPAK